MGLALLLLKLVQLHQCYHGNKPTLYVNVLEEKARYFQTIGFTTVDDEEEEQLVMQEKLKRMMVCSKFHKWKV